MASPFSGTTFRTVAEGQGIIVMPPPHGSTVVPGPHDLADPNDPQFSVPIFDFAALTAGSPEERSRLREVCRDWGIFILTNHGVPESSLKRMMESSNLFFQLPEEKKKRLAPKKSLDPVEYGTSPYVVDGGIAQIRREFYKFHVHPHFHTIDDPVGFSEALEELAKRTREIAEGLTEAISESLGLQGDSICKAVNLDEALQVIAGNYYPPYPPQSDVAIGIIPHTDAGLFTLLFENDISGLQVEHNGKWVKVETNIPNSCFVNLSDHMQIFTNGKYKSVIHRPGANDQATRISLAISYAPPLDKIVEPSPELLKIEGERALYEAMTYREFLKLKSIVPASMMI